MRRGLAVLVMAALCAGSACDEDPPAAPLPSREGSSGGVVAESTVEPETSAEPETPAEDVEGPAEDVEAMPAEETEETECDRLLARYVQEREALARCVTAEDCVEEWPGVCPHGPHYVGRRENRRPFDALVRRIDARCRLPRCEAPAYLGPAACRDGRCVEQ